MNASGTVLNIEFDKQINNPLGFAALFSLTVDGVGHGVGSLQFGGGDQSIGFLLPSPIFTGQAVVLSYAKPADSVGLTTNDAEALPVVSFTTGEDGVPAVENNSAAIAPPALDLSHANSKVGTGGSSLSIVFDGPIATDNAPPDSAFSVTVDGFAIGFGAVLLSSSTTGASFTLAALSPKVRQGETVEVTYTDPTAGDDTNALQSPTGLDVPTFTVTVRNSSTLTMGVPRPPTALTATALGETIVDLAWTKPGNNGGSAITGYKIEVSTDGSTWTDLEDDTESTGTRYRHSGLSNGNTRHYRVSAINANGTSPASVSARATTMTGAHHAVPDPIYGTDVWSAEMTVGVSGTTTGYSSGGDQGTLSPATFAHNGTTIGVLLFRVTTAANFSFTLDSALGAGKYNLHLGPVFINVDRHASSGNAAYPGVSTLGWSHGDTVEVRLVQATAPGKPTGLAATASGTQIDLAWTAPASDGGRAVTGYRIEVSEDGGTNWDDLKANTGNDDTSYSHTGLAAGSTRHYRVSAINAVGPSEASDSVNASLDNAAPDAPTGLRAIADGTSKIELSWTAPALDGGSAITGYKIEVSSNGTTLARSDHLADTGNSDTSYTHSGLAAGNTRHYRVSAINTVGTSEPSEVVSDTTQPSATTCTPNPGDFWCGVVTVGAFDAGTIGVVGYGFVDAATDTGALSDTGFSVGPNLTRLMVFTIGVAAYQSRRLAIQSDQRPHRNR